MSAEKINITKNGILCHIQWEDFRTVFPQKLIEQGDFTKIGAFWNKIGQNEIDLIALNELNQY